MSHTAATVVVTGASAGFGLVLARGYVRRGATVVIVARGQRELERAAREVTDEGPGRAIPWAGDVTQQADIDALFAEVARKSPQLDILANIAGRSARGRIEDTTPELFTQLWELNFLSAVRCTRAALPLLRQARGSIINMGSLASKAAAPYLGAYPASKFALAAYSQQLRLELSPQVHVLLVCPGPLARKDAGSRYDAEAEGLPEAARRPGGGAPVGVVSPDWLADRVVAACLRRQPELVVPCRARWLFALSQLAPGWTDRFLVGR